MENSTNKSIPLSREEIKTLISRWQASGKSKTDFCMEEGIGYHRFNGWLRRDQKRKTAGSGFIPLRIGAAPPAAFAELHLSNGSRIVFQQSVASSYLRSLIR